MLYTLPSKIRLLCIWSSSVELRMVMLKITLKHPWPLQSQWTGKTGKLWSHMSQQVNYLYNVYISKVLSEQPGHFSKINIHKTEKITMKAHCVHQNMAWRVCNEQSCICFSHREIYNKKCTLQTWMTLIHIWSIKKFMNFMTKGNTLQCKTSEKLQTSLLDFFSSLRYITAPWVQIHKM